MSLVPSLSFSLSCLPLRQPENDNVISHSSTSPPSLLFFLPSASSASPLVSSLCIACWVCCPPYLFSFFCFYFPSQTTHTTHTQILTQIFFCPLPFLRHVASLLFLSSLTSFIYLTLSPILPVCSLPICFISSFSHHFLFTSLLLLLSFFYIPEIFLLSILHLPLPLISWSFSIWEKISFATRALQYWSFLTHTQSWV